MSEQTIQQAKRRECDCYAHCRSADKLRAEVADLKDRLIDEMHRALEARCAVVNWRRWAMAYQGGRAVDVSDGELRRGVEIVQRLSIKGAVAEFAEACKMNRCGKCGDTFAIHTTTLCDACRLEENTLMRRNQETTDAGVG